jgi:hypothetical protein
MGNKPADAFQKSLVGGNAAMNQELMRYRQLLELHHPGWIRCRRAIFLINPIFILATSEKEDGARGCST